MKRILLLAITVVLAVTAAFPQSRRPSKVLRQFCDTVAYVRDSIYKVDSLEMERPLVYDVDMYKLFMAPVIYDSSIRQKFMPDLPQDTARAHVADRMFDDYTKVRDIATDTTVNNLLYNLYLTEFDLDYITEATLESYASYNYDGLVKETPTKQQVFSLFKPESNANERKKVDARINISKPNFWKFQGNASVQFSQNYISPNWYKGGESSNSILSYLMFNANYNDKKRIEFDNRLEAKVGFVTVPSDTLHKFNFNSDLLRLTSKLGVRAFNKWYYTLSVEFNTQFFDTYNLNSPTRVSSFMAPGNLIFNIGMDYKLSREKVELSAFLSPLTYNFRYVGDPNVDETQFGLEEGDKVLNSFGSTFQFNMKWTIIPSIIWETRFNYFTSYQKIETEWENTFNFILNRYLSAKLFVHARYYDMEAEHRIQWNELLSFGINYNW